MFLKTEKDLFYSNSKGIVQTGWQTIKGKKYYFDKKSPYKAAKGYKEIDGKLYYFYKGSRVLRTGIHKTEKDLQT